MFDINQAIEGEYGEADEELFGEYLDGLIEEFARSPEAQPLLTADEGLGWAEMALEYAFNHIGCTPPKMTLRDFNEVLFSIMPRKVSVEADRAGAIIAELRAFWSFVVRQYGLENAKAILASLDDRAADRLHRELANPANFGMAKSFVMMGSKAGFDMTTQEGMAAFQAAYNASLHGGLPGGHPVSQQPDLTRPVHEQRDSDAIKKKRKEKRRQREAKKRNRR